MKTQIMLGMIALSLMLVAMPLALAEDNSSTDINSTVISNLSNTTSVSEDQAFPKDETASNWKIGWSKVKLWFTFDQATKAEKELEVANMLLIMSNQAMNNNDSEAAAKYMDAYNLMMKDVQRRTDLANGGNINQTGLRLVALNNAIYVHEKKIAFLQTKLASANLTEEQQAKLEDKIAHAENVTSQLQDLHDQKEERLKTQLMATQNLTEEQADEKIANLEDKYSIPALKEKAKELKEQAEEENKTVSQLIREKRLELREELRHTGDNSSDVENSNTSEAEED